MWPLDALYAVKAAHALQGGFNSLSQRQTRQMEAKSCIRCRGCRGRSGCGRSKLGQKRKFVKRNQTRKVATNKVSTKRKSIIKEILSPLCPHFALHKCRRRFALSRRRRLAAFASASAPAAVARCPSICFPRPAPPAAPLSTVPLPLLFSSPFRQCMCQGAKQTLIRQLSQRSQVCTPNQAASYLLPGSLA